MSEKNAYQVADWNGQSGERWVANQVRLDHMLAAFGDAAITAAAPAVSEHVPDIGCGAGASSFALAALVGPRGHVRRGRPRSRSGQSSCQTLANQGVQLPHLEFSPVRRRPSDIHPLTVSRRVAPSKAKASPACPGPNS